MNAIIEQRSTGESAFTALIRAKALIEGYDFHSAARVYFQLLDTELTVSQRGEVLTNLGAALYMLARGRRGTAAQAQLDRARDLLVEALPLRQRLVLAPEAWATTRANLAMVHMARYAATGNSDELLSAHLALDGIEPALHDAAETALRDWVAAIRDQLLELCERRGRRR